MKYFTSNTAKAIALSCLFYATPSLAVPTLQLGIEGGTYNINTNPDCNVDTTCANSDSFTLYALLGSSQQTSNLIDDTFRISAALAPKEASAANYGSFVFDGSTIAVTDDMTFGTPPVDDLSSPDGTTDTGDLASHSIFETYFKEFSFQFDSSNIVAAFNVQDEAGKSITDYTPASGEVLGQDFLYYAKFEVDVSFLSDAHSIHFDLYNTKICDQTAPGNGPCTVVGDVDSDLFAPFSHDAQSGLGSSSTSSSNGGSGGSSSEINIPEPSTHALLGLAFIALGFYQRKRKTSLKA